MKVTLSSIFTLVLFQNTLSEQLPLNDFDIDNSATLSSQQLDYINQYIEDAGRQKRFVGQAVSSAALGSATAGSRHITNSIGKLIGGASRSISSFSDHSGSGGDSGGHHYGPTPEHHDSSGKLKEAWEIKKIILSSLLQAAKAVNGGLLAIGGKLIKGSGYLIEAKGRFLASKGDVVSNLGKKIVYAAKTQPSSWSSSEQSIEIPVGHHTSSGPGNSYGPPPSHFPSAPSSGYGPPPSSYHSVEEPYENLPDGVEAGLLILKKVQKNTKTPTTTDTGTSGIPPFKYLPLETDPSAPIIPNYPPLTNDPIHSSETSSNSVSLNLELSPPTTTITDNAHTGLGSYASPPSLLEYYKNVHDIEIGTQKDLSDLGNSFQDQTFSTSNDIPTLKASSSDFLATDPFTTDFSSDSSSSSNFQSTFPEFNSNDISDIKDQTFPPKLSDKKRPKNKFRFYGGGGGGKNRGRNVRVAQISINLSKNTSQNHPKYRNVSVRFNRGKRPIHVSKSVAYELGPNGPIRID